MCISETIYKLKVSLYILTSPMEYDNKNKTNKNFGRKFLYGLSRNLQRGTKALINICSNKNFKNTLLNRSLVLAIMHCWFCKR